MSRYVSILILCIVSLCLICISGCSKYSATEPVQPDDNEYFNYDLVGYWELVEADSLFEGDLFITIDGIGTEYAAVGLEFQKNSFDFREVNYILAGDTLLFEGRHYRRDSDEPVESICKYFPDEGLVKLFLINDNVPLSVKLSYDHQREMFIERRSLWSNKFGFERDSIGIIVDYESVSWYYWKFGIQSWNLWQQIIKEREEGDQNPPQLERSYIIQDTTFTAGRFQRVDVINYNRDFRIEENPTLMEEIEYYMLQTAYFAPGLGAVLLIHQRKLYPEYSNSEDVTYRVELVNYFNPLNSNEAYKARSDRRHIMRNRSKYFPA